MTTTRLSPAAAVALGALNTYLRPRLAQDAKVDLKTILRGTTAKNLANRVPAIAYGVRRAVRGKLAQDADVEDVEEVLEAIQEMAPEIAETASGPDEPEDLENHETEDSPDVLAKVLSFLEEKGVAPEILNELTELIGREDAAAPEDEPPGEDETEEERMERERRGAEDEPPDFKGKPRVGGAMDARSVRVAVDQAISRERKRASDLREAEKFVRPIVGDLSIALDSAEAVYEHALKLKGVDTKGLHPSGYRALLERLPRAGASRQQSPRLAADGTPPKSFAERFPGAARIQSI